MEKTAAYIKNFFQIYAKIVTWTLFSTSCFITLFWGWGLELDVGLLWQVQGVAAVCAAGSIFIIGDLDRVSKKKVLIKFLLNYGYVNGTVLAGGVCFDWFNLSDWKMVASMLALIAVGYLIILIFGFCIANREAGIMNRKLAEQEDFKNRE